MAPGAVVFYLLASMCVVSAFMVVTRRNPIHAALYLVLTFFCVAGIYVVLSAEFLAAVQVLVYAGGIMVLFLFVIMLVPLEAGPARPPARHIAGSLLMAGLAAGSLVIYFWNALDTQPGSGLQPLAAGAGNIETVGMELYQRYLLPFEIASVLLLAAMVGAVVLARKQT